MEKGNKSIFKRKQNESKKDYNHLRKPFKNFL